ncbi:MAG: RNA 2',3'-cyclic phosphodiesterase [Anaerolineae bacterium]|nr:RNA 2',3'-cyclic phosphodiesterase [Anaerolineae bacterium]
MTDTIRAFIAIELPPDVKQELGRIGQSLALQMPPRLVRWVQPGNMHLTLRFLGDAARSGFGLAVAQLPSLGQQLDELAAHHAPFSLQLGRLGCFPNAKRPRVIWVGIAGAEALLRTLKQDLDERLTPLGWAAEDKPFSAHLTIGRVNDGRLPATLNWDIPVNPLPFTVNAIHLIESRLTPKGPLYTVRHTAVLRRS